MKKTSRVAVLGVVASAVVTSGATTARAQVQDGLGIVATSAMNGYFASGHHPSYAARSMTVVVSTGNGSRTSVFTHNASMSDVYAIASNTKPFTSMLAVLQNENLVLFHPNMTLDSTLADWVSPSAMPRATSTSITLRDLADMCSGLARDPAPGNTTKEQLYDLVFSQACAGPPGGNPEQVCGAEGWNNYSNFGYSVLGDVLADYYYGEIGNESGASRWGDLVKERLLTPLGLDHTGTVTAAGDAPANAVTGYACSGPAGQVTCTPAPVATNLILSDHAQWAGGGLWSDATDMGQWLNLNLGNFSLFPGLSVQIQDAVTDYLHVYVHPGTSWGLGWVFDHTTIDGPSGKMTMMYKAGELLGFMSYVAMLPADVNAGTPSRGVAVMANFGDNPDQTSVENDLDAVATTILQQMVDDDL